MTDTAIRFNMWWISWRHNVDDYFMPAMTILAVISGGICLFSGIHVLKTPYMVHIFEFIFTLSVNMIFIFGLTRKSVEDNIKCLVALPSALSSLAYAMFVVLLRVVPHYSQLTPWFVSFENALLQKTWMTPLWIGISIVGGLFIQFIVYWSVSRSKILDILWPFLTYALVTGVFNLVMNFFLFIANYSTKAFGNW